MTSECCNKRENIIEDDFTRCCKICGLESMLDNQEYNNLQIYLQNRNPRVKYKPITHFMRCIDIINGNIHIEIDEKKYIQFKKYVGIPESEIDPRVVLYNLSEISKYHTFYKMYLPCYVSLSERLSNKTISKITKVERRLLKYHFYHIQEYYSKRRLKINYPYILFKLIEIFIEKKKSLEILKRYKIKCRETSIKYDLAFKECCENLEYKYIPTCNY